MPVAHLRRLLLQREVLTVAAEDVVDRFEVSWLAVRQHSIEIENDALVASLGQPSVPFAKGREKDYLSDRALARKQHDQTVDADTKPSGRRHAVLQSDEEVIVRDLSFLVACGPQLQLRLKALALLQRVVQLAVRVAK